MAHGKSFPRNPVGNNLWLPQVTWSPGAQGSVSSATWNR